MCGIAGIYHLDKQPVSIAEIDKLTDAVAHRGPDGRGVWRNDMQYVALGHRRLSILDLSDAGKQPMPDGENRFWITFNGEIYNFLEISKELAAKGYHFHSASDTEVILAAYREWGQEMLHRFNGMWAFAIYDAVDDSLFISRDRFGVKPLYYYYKAHRLMFSSEVQAIHQLLGPQQPLNEYVLKDVLRGGFINHGTTETYLKDVYSLPGGYSMLIKNGKAEIKQWYELQRVDVPATFEEQAEALKALVYDACALRLRSDVPIGTCLSGGVDSGSITALINNYKPNGESRFVNYTHRSFCASFPDTPIDEGEAAQQLATTLGSQLDIITMTPPTAEELETAMQSCDGPMHSLAFFPIWRLYEYIKSQGITVTLDGQGPDEMLGGYRPLEGALNAAIQLRKPLWFWDLYRTYAAQGDNAQFSSKEFANYTLKTVIRKRIGGLFSRQPVQHDAATLNGTLHPVRLPQGCDNPLDETLYKQFFQSPLPGILQQYDRCSMAHAVECRMPFMDYRIVEFVFSLPLESKVGGGYTKRVLREAMKGILPDNIRLNKLKIGFNAPIVDWFRSSLREWMRTQMAHPDFVNSPYFDGKAIRVRFEEFLSKPNPNWDEAWKFWPPVHFTWWQRNVKKVTAAEQV